MQKLKTHSFDGTELVADVWNGGAGATLILLPAGAETRSVWGEVVAHMPAELRTTWRIVAPDHRGHGESGRSETYRFDLFCGDLGHWMTVLGGNPLVVAGGSIGGVMGMVMAGEGAAIDGVVLLDVPTVPRLPRVLVERARIKEAHAAGRDAVRTIDPSFIDSGFIENIFEDSDRWRRAAVQLRVPVLLIAGERGVIGEAQKVEYRRNVPHGEFAVLRTGHLVAREDPRGVASLLSRFLAKHY